MSELKDRFEHALRPEPSFETDLATALDAAVRGGRRRRARAVASKALVVTACAVVIAGAVVAVRPGGSPTPGEGGVVGSASSPAPSDPCTLSSGQVLPGSSLAPMGTHMAAGDEGYGEELAKERAAAAAAMPFVRVVGLVPEATMQPVGPACAEDGHNGAAATRAAVSSSVLAAVVNAVAASVGAGKVSIESPGFATVRTDAGTYSVDVAVWVERFDAHAWADSCSPSGSDDKPCKVEGSSTNDLARSIRFTDGSGRVSLQYVADAGTDPDGQALTVVVTVDNYVEQASGSKAVGPTWHDLGFTRGGLRDAIAGTGVFS